MSVWNLSVVIIVPAALQEKGNKLACALGHDVMPGNTFSVPLSADGTEPATHFGCRTAAAQAFVDMITGAGEGALPDDLRLHPFGLTQADVFEVVSALIVDVRSADEMIGHFDSVIEANGLKRVVLDED